MAAFSSVKNTRIIGFGGPGGMEMIHAAPAKEPQDTAKPVVGGFTDQLEEKKKHSEIQPGGVVGFGC